MNRLQEALKEVNLKEVERKILISRENEVENILDKITQKIDDNEDLIEDMSLKASALLTKIQLTKNNNITYKELKIIYQEFLDSVVEKRKELGGVL